MPCYLRPERTRRAIQCILDQDIDGWEAFLMGDCCPEFQKLIDSGYLEQIKQEQEKKGNIIHYFNAEKHGSGWGYELTNHAIQNASGKYFLFLDNDDIIMPNHFRHYLSEIEGTEYDLVYYNSYLAPHRGIRGTYLGPSAIGHCDIIVKTEVAKAASSHDNTYAHDWKFISEICEKGKCKKASSKEATYHVMRLPIGPTIDNID